MIEHAGFFERAGPFALGEIAGRVGAEVAAGSDASMPIGDVRPLSEAGPGHLTILDNRKYLALLPDTRTSVCLIQPALADRLPASTAALMTRQPYRGFALAMQMFYPGAMHAKCAGPQACDQLIHPTARIEEGVQIEPGAVIAQEAWIRCGARICAGRHCRLGDAR